jgi:Na+/melibiose symporter-like transporter
MAVFGYSADSATQTPYALMGIKVLYIFCTATGMVLSGIVMVLFSKKTRIASK